MIRSINLRIQSIKEVLFFGYFRVFQIPNFPVLVWLLRFLIGSLTLDFCPNVTKGINKKMKHISDSVTFFHRSLLPSMQTVCLMQVGHNKKQCSSPWLVHAMPENWSEKSLPLL